VPLFLAGGRSGPDASAVSLARELPVLYAARWAQIAAALLGLRRSAAQRRQGSGRQGR
jgi:hypothetical protein